MRSKSESKSTTSVSKTNIMNKIIPETKPSTYSRVMKYQRKIATANDGEHSKRKPISSSSDSKSLRPSNHGKVISETNPSTNLGVIKSHRKNANENTQPGPTKSTVVSILTTTGNDAS